MNVKELFETIEKQNLEIQKFNIQVGIFNNQVEIYNKMFEILEELIELKSSSFILDELQDRAKQLIKEATEL